MRKRAITRGFTEDILLRKRYQEEGFGLETVFENREWAEARIRELRCSHNLSETDVRLVEHVSTPETGERGSWEVYVSAMKGLSVLFLDETGLTKR